MFCSFYTTCFTVTRTMPRNCQSPSDLNNDIHVTANNILHVQVWHVVINITKLTDFPTQQVWPCLSRRPCHQRWHHRLSFHTDLQSPAQFSSAGRGRRGGALTAVEPHCEGDRGRARPSWRHWDDTVVEKADAGVARWCGGFWGQIERSWGEREITRCS